MCIYAYFRVTSINYRLILNDEPICFHRHIRFLNSVKMEDSESQLLSDEEQTPEALFSSLDIILFSLITGLLIYWFFFRKTAEPVPEIKPFTAV